MGTQIKRTTADFIAKAQMAHGPYTYDYSRAVYKGKDAKVLIICPIHGHFEQRAADHWKGRGCAACKGGVKQSVADFVAKAQAVHGLGTYDYSLVEYKRSHNKVRIMCPTHGVFEQAPALHLYESGCPRCGAERTATAARLSWVEQSAGRVGTLYFLRLFSEEEEFFKVGITLKSIKARFGYKEALNGYHYEVLALHQSTNAAAVYDWEQSILETFAHLRYRPKRSFGGETECFSSADEILAIFPL